MSKVRVAGLGVSLDGFSAGTEQSLKDPLGKGGSFNGTFSVTEREVTEHATHVVLERR